MDYNEEIKFICLLERVNEPLYLGPKGHGSTKYLYNLPADHLKPYQARAMVELRKLIPPTTHIVEIPVNKTTVPYDLKHIQTAVPQNVVFSEMHGPHLQAANELFQILKGQATRAEFFNACALCRDLVNSHLWVYSFIKAVLRRADMRGIRIPAVWEIMPDVFVEGKIWGEALKQATLPSNTRGIIVIDKNFSGSDLNPNHKIAYFMEDVGGNAHHWHWHLVNPSNEPKGTVDRKGEIFYYMHHNMLGRYDCERLANGLNRVEPFDIRREDFVEEACFPKLTLQNSGVHLAGRQEHSMLKDFNRFDLGVNRNSTLSNLRAWLNRVIEAIDAGFAIQEGGGRVDLRAENGIDVATAMWESSLDSPHRKFYGISHNYGHSLIALLHDPDFRYKEPPAAMFVAATSMRDPIFYRWHKFLDSINQRQKDYLQLYPQENLQWNGVTVGDVQVIRGEDVRLPTNLNSVNNLVTHWMQSDIELSRGLDFGRTSLNDLGSVWVRVTHLQHIPFQYRIRATNQNRTDVRATVRIFMAPKIDENGDKLPFYEQRILFFEMDKFTTTIHPGDNLIVQKSEDSTLTIPWSQTFRDIERDTTNLTRAQAICSCGWPDHLLLPRGTLQGMPFDVFVMLTNTQIDQVPSSKHQLGTLTAKGTCRDSISFCGLIDDKVPDSRAMGYPFDRPAIPNERSKPSMFLSDFTAPVSNMATTEIKIYHLNKTIVRGNGAPENMRKVQVAP